ncbi:hypothetical protein BMS3Abin16_01289 [archaeon BMS3Abin16]|nr:hypothetical protein BMS3Abin16_01289 [archaeon BMS3Abin16]
MIHKIIFTTLVLLILSVIYGLTIFGIIVILRRIGISRKKGIVLSFLIFGAVTGFLVARVWPKDLIMFINIFTTFLGEEVYQFSILYLGDISSSQAHYTIPWILRIPQVYAIVSIVFWGVLGLLLQRVYNKRIDNGTPTFALPHMMTRKKLFYILGITGIAILGGIILTAHVWFQPAPRIGGEQKPLTDLMLPADELPNEWTSLEMYESHYIRYTDRPEIKMIWNSLQYNATGGPATLRVYEDPNRIAFNEEFGWAKDLNSPIQKFSYRGVPVFKYRTFMGYFRYLTHIDSYTFIFDAGIYGTDSYQASEAPEEDTDKLFKAVIRHALSRNLKVSEVEMPEQKKENFTIFVKNDSTLTSKDFTAEELADMPVEQLAMLVPEGVLERFTLEELANFTSDELAHIIPSKFSESETQYPFEPLEPKRVPLREDEAGR